MYMGMDEVQEGEAGISWAEEYDVVVIGSGFAGLAAALEARLGGSEVIVLEKMRIPGGNSAISGGLFAAAGSPLQHRDGIEDRPELMLEDMLKAGMELNHPELAHVVASNSSETLKWTIDYLGVAYKDNLNQLGGHSVPRTYITKTGTGSGIIQPMLEKCRHLGIEVRMRARFSEFVQAPDGRVTGVAIQAGYYHPNEESGTLQYIRARQGVVLATGGFGGDVSFRSIQDPRLTHLVDTTNHSGATAEGLIAAMGIGGSPLQLCWIQLGPWASFDEKGWGVGSMFTLLAGFPYGIMVDANTGKRFVNETSDRRLRTDAMLMNDRTPVAIVDSEGVSHATTLEKCLKRGVVKAFNSIEELATYNMIPLEALRETLERYNLYLQHGRDAEFGKPLQAGLKPIGKPPYYSIRLLPKVHYCMGGIKIDTQSRVVHIKSGRPIEGLYAAGEVTGGIHGASRLGSNSVVECLVFGRIAGKNVCREMH
ncbi:flavocytochrome c [Desulfosediminicola ganghwensis]|uniref:flavocytochrome c n=1 Tax=Desulfosediminicola ganghwensis TaxID=2569540 RepID=UPI0010AC7B3D|nr:flavocytochrome c [Desulfosediminicola ganghwensis]